MPDPLESTLPRKIIRNPARLVAWDETAQSHCYRRDVDLVIEGETIAAIGPAGPADHRDGVEIDGRGFAILPGFIDIHAHPSSEPMLKGLTDEVGSRQLYMSSLRDRPLLQLQVQPADGCKSHCPRRPTAGALRHAHGGSDAAREVHCAAGDWRGFDHKLRRSTIGWR